MKREEWRPVPGYEGLYEVSDHGRIKNRFGKILQLNMSGRYITCGLCKNGKQTTTNVHRLMGLAFLPNPEGLRVVRHLNDDQHHNHLSNLAWGSDRDNSEDARRNGIRVGSPGKLDDESVRLIKATLVATKPLGTRRPRGTLQRIAVKFGVSVDLISCIAAGRSHA